MFRVVLRASSSNSGFLFTDDYAVRLSPSRHRNQKSIYIYHPTNTSCALPLWRRGVHTLHVESSNINYPCLSSHDAFVSCAFGNVRFSQPWEKDQTTRFSFLINRPLVLSRTLSLTLSLMLRFALTSRSRT